MRRGAFGARGAAWVTAACGLGMVVVHAGCGGSVAPAPGSTSPGPAPGDTAPGAPAPETGSAAAASLTTVIDSLLGMNGSPELAKAADAAGLSIVDLNNPSGGKQAPSVPKRGPDFTFQIINTGSGGSSSSSGWLPIFRTKTVTPARVKASAVYVRVGNHTGAQLQTKTLSQLLGSRWLFSQSNNLPLLGTGGTDPDVVVTAQAVYIPVSQQSTVEFTPVMPNPGSGASMVMVATRQGVSTRVFPVGTSGAQQLYFDLAGQRAPFTVRWKKEVREEIEARGGPRTDDERSALSKSANVVYLIQVPLRRPPPPPPPSGGGAPTVGISGSGGGSRSTSAKPKGGGGSGSFDFGSDMAAPEEMASDGEAASIDGPDSVNVNQPKAAPAVTGDAVVGHGAPSGSYSTGDGAGWERDPSQPIRVVIQFYQATSRPIRSAEELNAGAIATTLQSVSAHPGAAVALLAATDPEPPKALQNAQQSWFPW